MTTTEPATAVQHMIRRRKPRSDPNSKAANDAGPGKEAHADVCDQNRFGFVQYSFILLLSLLCALAWWAKNHSTNSWLPSDPRQPMTIASRVTGSSIQNESQASPQSGASSTEDTALPVQHLESDATTEEVNDEFRMQVPKLLPTAQFDRREEVYSGADVPYEAFIDVFVRNANLSQPLLQFQDNAMPDNEFQDLQECLREHPMRHSNVNDGDTFKGTRGFLLSYNKAGIDKFASNPSFSCLEPYFRRHVRPDADAWVLNMVWADIPDYRKELAIQRHTDDGRFHGFGNQVPSRVVHLLGDGFSFRKSRYLTCILNVIFCPLNAIYTA